MSCHMPKGQFVTHEAEAVGSITRVHARIIIRRICVVAILLCVVGVVGLVVGLGVASTVAKVPITVIVGSLTGQELVATFIMVGLLGAFVAAWASNTDRWAVIAARVLLGGAFFAALLVMPWLLPSVSVTRLDIDGKPSNLLVREENRGAWAPGTVYRQHGIILTEVGRTGGDDGFKPFLDGAYLAQQDGDVINIWYSVGGLSGSAQAVTTTGPPDLRIPVEAA